MRMCTNLAQSRSIRICPCPLKITKKPSEERGVLQTVGDRSVGGEVSELDYCPGWFVAVRHGESSAKVPFWVAKISKVIKLAISCETC